MNSQELLEAMGANTPQIRSLVADLTTAILEPVDAAQNARYEDDIHSWEQQLKAKVTHDAYIACNDLWATITMRHAALKQQMFLDGLSHGACFPNASRDNMISTAKQYAFDGLSTIGQKYADEERAKQMLAQKLLDGNSLEIANRLFRIINDYYKDIEFGAFEAGHEWGKQLSAQMLGRGVWSAVS